MARQYFSGEKGLRLYKENSSTDYIEVLFGSAAPGGDTGEQDDAPLGSIYIRQNGIVYSKIADTNATSDWAVTSATFAELSSGYTPANGDPAAGDTYEEAFQKIDGNVDDLNTLSGVAQGAQDLGTFTGATIPDSSDIKEALQALETAHEEVDQNVNDLITLSGVAENATTLGTFTGDIISDNDTVKGALQDLETELVDTRDNVDDLITLSGVAENAEDLGTFTGTTIPDASDIKEALQALETAVEGVGEPMTEVTGLTTLATVDSVLVDNYRQVMWMVDAFEEATPANVKSCIISASHNGTASADATSVSDQESNIHLFGSAFNLVLAVDLNGTGGSQVMRLRASSSTAGVQINVRRMANGT